MTRPVIRVCICIATCKRPTSLSRLLHELNNLVFANLAEPQVRIVVVDNDATRSARVIVERHKATCKWPITYRVEPRRGISFARNTAIEEAGEEVDFIAFLDDDEVPRRSWLAHLLLTQQTHNADMVTGPVLPRFEAPVPEWIESGGFFERPRHQDGSAVPYAGAGNLLFRTTIAFAGGIKFNERMALTGGEDAHFSMLACRAGYTLVWSDDAVVDEWTPASRATVRWLLLRSYRGGSSFSQCLLELDPRCRVRGMRLCRASAATLVAGVSLIFAAFRGTTPLVRALQRVMQGAGGVCGALGWHYEEYRTIHGS